MCFCNFPQCSRNMFSHARVSRGNYLPLTFRQLAGSTAESCQWSCWYCLAALGCLVAFGRHTKWCLGNDRWRLNKQILSTALKDVFYWIESYLGRWFKIEGALCCFWWFLAMVKNHSATTYPPGNCLQHKSQLLGGGSWEEDEFPNFQQRVIGVNNSHLRTCEQWYIAQLCGDWNKTIIRIPIKQPI